MRRDVLPCAWLIALVVLTGCGQSGDLYLPEAGGPAPERDVPVAVEPVIGELPEDAARPGVEAEPGPEGEAAEDDDGQDASRQAAP